MEGIQHMNTHVVKLDWNTLVVQHPGIDGKEYISTKSMIYGSALPHSATSNTIMAENESDFIDLTLHSDYEQEDLTGEVISCTSLDDDYQEADLTIDMMSDEYDESTPNLTFSNHVQASLLIGAFIHVRESGLCYNARVIHYDAETSLHRICYDRSWLLWWMSCHYLMMCLTGIWLLTQSKLFAKSALSRPRP